VSDTDLEPLLRQHVPEELGDVDLVFDDEKPRRHAGKLPTEVHHTVTSG
jgi:hypothetical protein